MALYKDIGYDNYLSIDSLYLTLDGSLTNDSGDVTPDSQVVTSSNVDLLISSGSIIDDSVESVGVSKLTTGIIESKQITLDIKSGQGDVYIACGKTDFGDTTNGFILGIDDSDSDKVKFEFGGATDSISMSDGSISITGSISATSGTIGGWTISTNALTSGSGTTMVGLDSGGTNPAIYAGSATPASAPFRVTSGGAVTCSDINITGGTVQWSTVSGTTNAPDNNATYGANWTTNLTNIPDSAQASYITSTKITSTTIESPIISANSGYISGTLKVGSSGIVIDGVNTKIYSSNYSSGTTGWVIYNSGSAEFNNITVRGAVYATSGSISGSLVTSGLNADNIITGTLTGRTVKSSSGTTHIDLDNGNSIKFYTSNTLRSTLTGTSVGAGGFNNTGDYFAANNRTYWIASTTGGSTEYGGIGVDNSNNLNIHCGKTNAVYIMNNATSASLYVFGTTALTVGSSTYSPNVLPYNNNSQNLGDSTHIWDDVFCSTAGRKSGNAIWFDQAGRVQVDNHFDPSGVGSYNTGGASRYWADVSYKTLTDRGCLGWFDEGVELQDGTVVSDIEAIQAIKKHPTKKTIYGVSMLDYKTFPKVSYKKAADHDGNEYPRNKNDEPYVVEYNKKTGKNETIIAADGIEMTSMFSIIIGALKELDNRIKIMENN